MPNGCPIFKYETGIPINDSHIEANNKREDDEVEEAHNLFPDGDIDRDQENVTERSHYITDDSHDEDKN